MLNKCIFMGRLAADPEMKTTTSGTPCCTFRLAVERDYKEKDGTRATDWLNFVAWKGTAEFISRYFQKGQTMIAVCSAQVRTFERDGEKRSVVEFVTRDAYFAGKLQNESTTANEALREEGALDNIRLPWEGEQ